MVIKRVLAILVGLGILNLPVKANAHIRDGSLTLKCDIEEKYVTIVISETLQDGTAPLIIYNSKGETFLSFNSYSETEQSFSAVARFPIGDQKQVIRSVNINRVSGEFYVNQKIQTVFGKSSKDKEHDPFVYKGSCSKVESVKQKF